MAITTTLAACSTNPALNGPDGADLPSTLDDAIRYALSFIAQLRDGAGMSVGMIAQFPATTAPAGWLKLDGSVVSRAAYPALWAFAANLLTSEAGWFAGNPGYFSNGDLATNFRLPDFRGLFTRGLDESKGYDVGRNVGQFQDHANVSHTHGASDPGHSHGVSDPGHIHSGTTSVTPDHTHTYAATTVTTGAGASVGGTAVYGIGGATTDPSGSHSHSVSVGANATGISIAAAGTGLSIVTQGSSDGHPRNVALPFFIKY